MPERIKEFHSIQPISNIRSILEHGLLSHEAVKAIQHDDISSPTVQDRRSKIKVPNGLPLHQYANLYFDARNPMMYKLICSKNRDNLCVLRISKNILNELDGIVIADQNASSHFARFLGINQLNELDLDKIFAADWTHPEKPIEQRKHKSQKCAELLVPNKIDSNYIFGIYISSPNTHLQGINIEITTNSNIFFR